MTKAEQFIKDCTRDCSNELISVQDRFHNEVISYREWLTPEQALKAVEIERKELLEKACEWFRRIDYDDNIPPFETTEEFIEGFRKAMKL